MRTHTIRIEGTSKFWIDFKYLWLEQMMEVRANWYMYVLFSILLPIVMIFGFTHIGSGLSDQSSLLYIISGTVIFSMGSDAIYGLAMRVGEIRKDNALVFYATLPINRAAFILALICARLVVTIPGMITPFVIGILFFGFQMQVQPILIMLLPLVSITFAMMGLIIGAFIKDMGIMQMVINALLFVLVMLAPVFIPASQLPEPLRFVSYGLPITYAAGALRSAVIGTLDLVFLLNTGVLILTIVICAGILQKYWKLD